MSNAARVVAAGLVAIAVPLTAAAQSVPTVFTHQGRLLDAAGGSINGSVTLRLDLSSGDGTGPSVWSGTYDTQVQDGYYAVVLGADASNPIPSLSGLDGLWVGVSTVDSGGGVAPVGPRTPVHALPFASHSNSAHSVTGGPVVAESVVVNGQTVVTTDGTVPTTRLDGGPLTASGLSVDGQTVVTPDGTVPSTRLDGGPLTASQLSVAGATVVRTDGTLNAAQLDGNPCQTVSTTQNSNGNVVVEVSCPAGRTMVSGGCGGNDGDNSTHLLFSFPTSNGWHCRMYDNDSNNENFTAYARCCF